MNPTLEITPTEIGLKVGETVSVVVNNTAGDLTFTNDNDSVVAVKYKKGKLYFNGLLKGAANVIVSAEGAEDVRLVVSVLEESESGTVYFHSNGGKGSMNPQTIAVNETFSLPECGFEAPEGKVFVGWSEDANGESGIKSVNDLLQFHQDGEHTIYAIYEDAPEVDPEQPDEGGEVTPEPEQPEQPEEPKEEEKPADATDVEVTSLVEALDGDWDAALAELLAKAPGKYKSLIVKLQSYNNIYSNGLNATSSRDQAAYTYDLYVTIVDALEWSQTDTTRFENVTKIIKKFFAKFSNVFSWPFLTKELGFWSNAAYKPQNGTADTWRQLVKIFTGDTTFDKSKIKLSGDLRERLAVI